MWRQNLGEKRWFTKAVYQTIVAFDVFPEFRVFVLKDVEQFLGEKAGIHVSKPINVDHVFTAPAVEVGRPAVFEVHYILSIRGEVGNFVSTLLELQ